MVPKLFLLLFVVTSLAIELTHDNYLSLLFWFLTVEENDGRKIQVGK